MRWTSTTTCCALLTLVVLALPVPASAVATITIVNVDGPGEGFNDATAVTPAGGNPSHTVGGARLIAFQHAAFLWGSMLESDVEILVEAQFDPLPGGATWAVLGGCGAYTVARDFPGAPQAGTWYSIALANSLAGFDMAPADPDIAATFNSDVDGNVVLGTTHWYYGLDGNPPAGDIDFVTVVLHELAHGLGFQAFYDLQTGAKLLGFDDTYMLNLMCPTCTPVRLQNMTNTQRVAVSIAEPQLRWDGASVAAGAAAIPLTAGWFPPDQVQIYAPNPLEIGSSVSHFSDVVFPNQSMEPAYTGPNHDVGLALELMEDIGWNLDSSNGTDIVFILDITGSTGALLPDWVNQIPDIATSWLNHDPNARFAVVSHVDYPFPPYGDVGEWAYRVETTFTTSLATLTAALGAITQQYGWDSPESQYEAIYQVLTGAGRDLGGALNYTDTGELPPSPLGQINPMVIYHFTYPELFHDRDLEPSYPFAGANPVAGRTMTENELAAQAAVNMFFGLTFITSKSAAVMTAKGDAVPVADAGPLAELAAATNGQVYSVGVGDLSLLQAAIDASIEHWARSKQGGDFDHDGIPDENDNCPAVTNEQLDWDEDKIGNDCDNCVKVYNPDQADRNRNGIGDACE